jgi:hypothetical protein
MRSTAFIAAALLALLLVTAGTARADRVPSLRTASTTSPGTRPDITVPYLTTGYSTIMSGRYVGVRIYASGMVDNPYLETQPPVYNLPFWGGIVAFGTRSQGAMPTGLAVTPRELSPAVRPTAAMPVGTTLNSTGN